MTPRKETVDTLRKEIELVLARNKNENYLKALLTRALIVSAHIFRKKRTFSVNARCLHKIIQKKAG